MAPAPGAFLLSYTTVLPVAGGGGGVLCLPKSKPKYFLSVHPQVKDKDLLWVSTHGSALWLFGALVERVSLGSGSGMALPAHPIA